MGWPALIGLALTAAGTAASMKGASDTQSAENDKANQELLRQSQFQQQAKAQFAASLNAPGTDATSAKQTLDTNAQAQQQRYQASQSTPLATTATTLDPVVAARQQAAVGQQSGAQARLSGYNQWGTDQAIKNLLAAQQLGVTGSLAQASGNVLPLELQQASHTGDTLGGIGSILNTLGSVVGVAGTGLGWGARKPAVGPYGTVGFANGGGTVPVGGYPAFSAPSTWQAGGWGSGL